MRSHNSHVGGDCNEETDKQLIGLMSHNSHVGGDCNFSSFKIATSWSSHNSHVGGDCNLGVLGDFFDRHKVTTPM
ncbi:hypothetical protein SAMN05444373_102314 [Thermoclostridium caenicola]|uniref:Uncharacterized protein n=1 Tax=Thermoclostridium caenicola TaxID=659425 RepID=A0A1M6GDG1_9FIRM|nr:hypothetical protein SAMN05444373_102314 [Thermoclostridium caenicola]